MAYKEVGNVSGNLQYIDIFRAGNTIGIHNVDGRVQTGIEVINIIEQCGNVIGMSYDEEALSIIFRFDSNIALKIYGENALESFWDLIISYPELGKKLRSQVQVLNAQDTKKNLKETEKRVKRMNKYARRRAKAGLATICSVVLGVSTISFFTKDRSESDVDNTNIISSETYELPVENEIDIAAPTITLPENESNCIKLDYEDRSFSSKAVLCKESYYDKIVKYATMYGVDPQIMLGIATQERGTHSEVVDDSGAIGLMQLEMSVWSEYREDAVLTAYNYAEGKRDTFTLPLEDIGNIDNNIRYSCMIFQNCMTQMDDNVIAAIQEYNYGYGNMLKVFANYKASTNISMEEALKDYNNLDWLDYRTYGINDGDPSYVENVLSWLGNETTLKIKTNDGDDKSINIRAKAYSKVL